MRKLFVFGAALALLAAGCGSNKKASTVTVAASPADEAAARAVVRVQAQLRRGDFAVAWRSLHPAEKRIVSAQRLASCYPRNEFPRTVTFRATRVQDVVWQVPGAKSISEAKEVTVTAKSPGKKVQTFTQHTVKVGGAWTWMLSKAYFGRARRGAC